MIHDDNYQISPSLRYITVRCSSPFALTGPADESASAPGGIAFPPPVDTSGSGMASYTAVPFGMSTDGGELGRTLASDGSAKPAVSFPEDNSVVILDPEWTLAVGNIERSLNGTLLLSGMGKGFHRFCTLEQATLLLARSLLTVSATFADVRCCHPVGIYDR